MTAASIIEREPVLATLARETDGLGGFLNRAGKIPLLTAAEEIQLGRQVQAMLRLLEDKPDPPYLPEERRTIRTGRRAKERMITGNIRLVVTIARRYANSARAGTLAFDDLIQDGMVGLMRAVDGFDHERGYKFSTYAYWWVRQSITRGIDSTGNTIRLPVHIRDVTNKIRSVTNRYEQEHGRPPSLTELTDELAITKERLNEILGAIRPIASLDAELREDGCTLAELLTANEPGEMMGDVEQSASHEVITHAISLLSERQSTVIKHHYGIDGLPEKNLTEIGVLLGDGGDSISRERVRQIRTAAMYQLRVLSRRQLEGV